MQPGPIPLRAIWEYADRYGFDDRFVSQIQHIDRLFLAKMESEGEEQANGGG